MRTALLATMAMLPAVSLASAAQGQTTETLPESTIQDIVVTAQKRTQNIQNTPISITAIDGAALASEGKTTLQDALRDVPGVVLQSLPQGAQVFIRGVGSGIDPSLADPAIALMSDGVYNGRTEALDAGAYDISRIEVLRGPQGTLYGRNATGGAINVITNSPKLGKIEGFVRGQIGNYDLYRGEAALNLPLGDQTAVRLSGFREKRDSYVDTGGMDSDAWGARGKLLFDNSAGLRLEAKAEYLRSKGYGPVSVPVPGSAGHLVFPPFLLPYNTTGWVQPDPGDPWSNNVEYSPRSFGGMIDRTSKSLQLQADVDLGFAALTVLPAYSEIENRLVSSLVFGTLAGPPSTEDGNATYKSIETRLASKPGSPVQWTLGAYYLYTGGAEGTDNMASGYEITTDPRPGKTLAFFGQATYPVTDRFRVTGGLRWSKDSQGKTTRFFSITPGVVFDSGPQSYSDSQRAVTYKAGIEYDLAPRSLLYAHVASGFKQGGMVPTIVPVVYKPERLTSYEVGVKTRLLDNRLQLNAAGFYYDYKNYQVMYNATLPLGDTGLFYPPRVVVNTSTPSTILGGEAAADWALSARDTLRLSLNYLRARYGEAVLPNDLTVNQGPFELRGRAMANAPKWTGNIGYRHSFDVAGGRLTAGIDSRLSSGYFASVEEYQPGARQKSFTRTNLSLDYTPGSEAWSVGLWARNIEDKAQVTYVFPVYRRMITAPFTFGADAEFNF